MTDFLALIDRAFPEKPIPDRFFWKSDDNSSDDIREELSTTLERRAWKKITILDWRMMGAPPVLYRSYLKPETFIYYLPSLIVSTSQDTAYIDFALEAIIPLNKHHAPRGEWWSEFSESVSLIQRQALCEFLLRIRRDTWNEIGAANQDLVQHAERIWSRSGG